MTSELRKTGISVVGDMPWGTHFCHFYETKEDLLEILIPYFKTGLANHEFCMWVVSGPLDEEEAGNALKQAVPEADRYLAVGNIEIVPRTSFFQPSRQQTPPAGRIEIVPHTEWYLKHGAFELEQVINGWKEKLGEALAAGYAGMRVNGNEAWLTEKDWGDFLKYEKKLSEMMANQRMIALCSYPLATSGAAEIFDVAHTHQFAIARRRGQWEVVETPELKQAKAEIKRLNEELEQRVVERTNELRVANEELSKDIGERKLAEEALRNAERKYRDIFEHAVEGIFQVKLGGGYISANPAQARMLGFSSPEELIRERSDPAKLRYADLRRREEYVRLLAEKGFVRNFEYEDYRKDGSTIWLSDNVRAVRDNEGALLYYEGTTQDITARKLAEQALRESEERYRELFENARDATYVHDLSGRYTSVNRAAEKLTGYTRAEILGKEFTHFVPSEQVERIRESLCRKLIDEGETAYETEVITKDGRRVAVEVSSHLIFENGGAIGVQGTARDITERKAAAEALFRLASIAEQSNDAIIGTSLEGIITNWNKGAERIYGHAAGEITGRPISVLIPPQYHEELPQILGRIGRGERIEHYETVRIRKDGQQIDVSLSVSPIRNATGTIVGASTIARDISGRRRAEGKLRATTEQLRALSARLQSAREEEGTRIAREIHDELGSLLTNLKWDLEGTDRMLAGPMKPSQLAALRKKLQALLKLTDLAISAIRRIASELRPSVLDDLGLVAAIEWQAQQFQARTEIVCHCDCSLEKVELSEEQSTAVFRILQEALTNVLRHAQATKVEIRINKEKGYFTLSISDNGKGISESEKSEQQSLGILGMRERAHLIGGQIDIKGAEGKGTVVIVRVPISGQDRVLKMTR